MLEVDEEQRQGRQALLAVDDELIAVLVADDDRPEEVVAIRRYGIPLVPEARSSRETWL